MKGDITTRNGKIARLSREVRSQLNRRLRDGEPGTRLVEWLNSQPEVQSVLNAEFRGRAVSEQNLSEWKCGGYKEWLTHQESLAQAIELAADASELAAATSGLLADHLAAVLTARYAATLSAWSGEADDELKGKLRSLRGLCQDIAELRRGEHSAARLKIEQERLERDREKTDEDVFEHFKRWLKNAAVRDAIWGGSLTPEERARRMRAIFGLPPEETPSPAGDSPTPGPSEKEESN